jgi:hypothetical protein
VGRGDPSFEEPRAAAWPLRLLLPVLVWAVAVAIVGGLVLGGVLHGDRTYSDLGNAPTTQPTVLIEPRVRKVRPRPIRSGCS